MAEAQQRMSNDEFIEKLAIMKIRRDAEREAMEKASGKVTFSNDADGVRKFRAIGEKHGKANGRKPPR